MLGLFWTSGARPAGPDVVRDLVVNRVEGEFARLGIPLRRLSVSGIVPEEGPSGKKEFTDATLEEFANLFTSGAPTRTTIMWESTTLDGRTVLVHLKLTGSYTGSVGWDCRFGVEQELFDGRGVSVDEVALGWTHLVAEFAGRARMLWAGISLDHWPQHMMQPPYEIYYGIPWEEAETRADRIARGYYWANLLTAGHLEALGGITEVSARCADLGLDAERVDAGNASPALLVRAGAAVGSMTDEQLAAVKELLDPILITRPYRWYTGWPLRVFKEPGTAFREIPVNVMAHAPVFEDDVPMNDDD